MDVDVQFFVCRDPSCVICGSKAVEQDAPSDVSANEGE